MYYEDIKSISKKGTPVYIWGAGEVGKLAFKKLKKMGVPVEDYLVDVQSDEGITPSELERKNSVFCIVRGWLGSFYMSDEDIKKRFPGCESVFTISDVFEPDFSEPLERDYYLNNKKSFMSVRDALEDELSKRTFDAYIKTKIERDNAYILPLVMPTQYFFADSPWVYKRNDVLVDCGAFDGDSIRGFVNLRGNQYKEIIAFEPDDVNFGKLITWIDDSKLQNITPIKAGVYKEKTVLSFNTSGDMNSSVKEDGGVTIPVESIDNVCAGKNVSIIKMDIEGSELDALIGGQKTIKKNKPILMISVYHRKDDLFVLKEYISDLNPDYKFFLRAHKPLALDTVLYAVSNDRLKRDM